MRNIVYKLLSLLLIVASALPLFSLTATATENVTAFWSENYYRAHDSLQDLSELERNELDEMCIDFMIENEVDLVLLSVLPEEYEGSTLQSLAEDYYADYEFGYGSDKSGIVFICDMVTRDAEYALFGDAIGLVDQTYLDFAAQSALEFYSANGIYGVLYSGGKFIVNYFEDGGTESEVPGDEISAETDETPVLRSEEVTEEPASTAGNMQVDLSLPRVVDKADIFSDLEEQELESRIYEVISELGRDIVVVTDTSSDGKTKNAYADDFFDYGGYGCGEDRDGVCMFICMDPDDRGFWISVSGVETRKPYTEIIANGMDAALQSFLKAGRYAEGVSDWIDNFYRLLTTGEPFTQDWLSEFEGSTERFHDSNAERVDDAAHVLTADERIALTDKAQKIAQDYDIDVVLHIVRDPGSNIAIEDYAERYYRHMGYGYGENYDGIALISLIRYSGENEAMIYTFGSGNRKLTAVNEKRLLGFFEDKVRISDPTDYNGAFDLYLDKLKGMEKTGRVARSDGYWMFICIAGLIIGLIVGYVSFYRATDDMKTVKIKSNADFYLKAGSLSMDGTNHFINTTKTQRYSPEKDRSSSSGSGGSSYSGGHTSSSGRSHSGSGRSF